MDDLRSIAREVANLLAAKGLTYEDAVFVLDAAKAELGRFRLAAECPLRKVR
ncbi:MAG TPA: hypothetical protein GX507_07935 [Clostridia bacterium]|nr:hypothetical protein [Clostridia bacterium]